LVYWVIKAAQKVEKIAKIVISTDCDQIAETVGRLNISNLQIHRRSEKNAMDASSTESVILEYIEDANLESTDHMMLIQATSPFTSSDDLKAGIQLYFDTECDSVLSVVENGHFLWNGKGESLNYDFQNRPRRQDFEQQFAENGAFYINKVSNILQYKNRLSGKIALSVMPKHTALELDDEEDWFIGENLMEKLLEQKSE